MNKRQLIKELIKNNISISFAESCTGGELSATLTKVPGVSKIFNMGLVTYSDESKVELLGVNPDSIKEYGVVSEEVAYEMSTGLALKSHADIAISTTGNAGPTKGDETKDVGEVYVGITKDGYTNVYRLELIGSRIENIKSITDFVYERIEELI
ncbi:MAG: CinA family protein [Gammaproteobacteria bacterium]|nr:CinA family protein [Gammaproteobacteria bacterium]